MCALCTHEIQILTNVPLAMVVALNCVTILLAASSALVHLDTSCKRMGRTAKVQVFCASPLLQSFPVGASGKIVLVTYGMDLNFCGTKFSRIENSIILSGVHFSQYYTV